MNAFCQACGSRMPELVMRGVPIGFGTDISVPAGGHASPRATVYLPLVLFALRWSGAPAHGMVGPLLLTDLLIEGTSLIAGVEASIALVGQGVWEFPPIVAQISQTVTARLYNPSGAPLGVYLTLWGKPLPEQGPPVFRPFTTAP